MNRRPRATVLIAILSSLILSLVATAAPAFAGNTRQVFIGSGADGALPSVTVSAGESIVFPLSVKNTGSQTLNNVNLAVGRDDNASVERNGQAAVTPTNPVGLPAGVTITATGGGGVCAGGAILTCPIGTLGARKSFDITVTISSGAGVAASSLGTKATVSVAEIGNDRGGNVDTFAAEGGLQLLAFSCDSVTAFRSGNQAKTVSTCPIGSPDSHGQSASVTIPSRLTTVQVTDNLVEACPVDTCIGDVVQVLIDGDTTADVVAWTIQIDLTAAGISNVNLQQLVAYHEDDAGNVTLIPFKRNACRTAASVNCGVASIATDSNGHSILTATLQTAGNGKTRFT